MNHRAILTASLLLLAPVVTSCSCEVPAKPGGAGTIPTPLPGVVRDGESYRSQTEPATALVIALDPRNVGASSEAAIKLLSETSRRSEHLDVVCGQQTIFATPAPSGAGISEQVSVPNPANMPTETTVQQKKKEEAEQKYQQAHVHAMTQVADQEREQLNSWLDSAKAALEHSTCPATDPAQAFAAALDQAEGFVSSLVEARVDVGQHKAVAVLGVDGMPLTPSPALSGQHLQGATVVICPFPGSWQEEAGWQAALVERGVGRAVLLTPGVESELPHVVTEGLRDASVFNLSADTLFAVGSSTLENAGKAALRPLLDDLISKDKAAVVVINGYTDTLPAPQGNDQLSQARAEAVRHWLIENGVPADHIQAVGHGEHDPIAPDGPDGQPLNRRVVVVVNPISAPSPAAVTKPDRSNFSL